MDIFVCDTEFILIGFGTFVLVMKKGIFRILQAVFANEVNFHDFHDFLNVVG